MNGHKNWQRNLLKSAVAASLLCGASLAGAATQGTVGATSTGSVDLEILVPGLILVNQLNDLTLTYTPGSDAAAIEGFCVWSTPGLVYDIAFAGDNPNAGTTFSAVSGGDSVEYSVEFDDQVGGAGWQAVVDGVTLNNGGAGFVPGTGATPGCTTENARIQVTALELANLDTAPAGVYQDTITLVVSPF